MIIKTSCENLTIKSELLDISEGKVITEIVLKSKLNCSLTQSSVTLTSLKDTIVVDTLIIPATSFYNDVTKTVYCDGVYNFELSVTYQNGETDVLYKGIETKCVFVDCLTKCKVTQKYESSQNRNIIYYYFALITSNDCDNCTCTDLCSIYNELKLLLNDTNTTSEGCGCS